MCYEIECERFLRDYFEEHRGTFVLRTDLLNRIKIAIENSSEIPVHINITRQSLAAVANSSNGSLTWECREIRISDNFLKNKTEFYLDDLPKELFKLYLNMIKTMV